MMGQSIAVVTFPIGVRSYNPKIGLFVPVVVAYALSKQIGGKMVLAINSIDSLVYGRDRYIRPFILAVESLEIKPDHVWVDGENKEELLFYVRELVRIGIIKEELKLVRSCNCGRVIMLDNAPIHKNARLYRITSEGQLCDFCHSLCNSRKLQSLVLRFNGIGAEPLALPKQARGRIHEAWQRISSMEYLVSRERDTGIQLQHREAYYLDVDNVWLQYLKCIDAERFVLVGSNHVAWHLSLASAYLRAIKPQAELEIVLTPYIIGTIPEEAKMLNGIDLALYLLLNVYWGNHETRWSIHNLRWLCRLTADAKYKLWSNISVGSGISVELKEAIKRISPQILIMGR